MNIMHKPVRGLFMLCLVVLLASCGFTEARIKREQQSEASYTMGIANLNGNTPNTQQAYIDFLKAIEISPNNKKAHYALGHVHTQRQDYAKAIEAFKKAISLDENYSEAHNYLGKIYETMGKDTEAISAYQGALKNIQYATPQLPYWNMGMIYFRQKKYDDALEAFQQTRKFEPVNGVVLAKIGETYTKQGEMDKALFFYKEAVTLAPTDHMAHYRLASFYFEKGPRTLAIEGFNKVISLSPQSSEAESSRKRLELLN